MSKTKLFALLKCVIIVTAKLIKLNRFHSLSDNHYNSRTIIVTYFCFWFQLAETTNNQCFGIKKAETIKVEATAG